MIAGAYSFGEVLYIVGSTKISTFYDTFMYGGSSILPLMATILISIQNNMQQFDLIYLWIDCVSVSRVHRWLVTMGKKF